MTSSIIINFHDYWFSFITPLDHLDWSFFYNSLLEYQLLLNNNNGNKMIMNKQTFFVSQVLSTIPSPHMYRYTTINHSTFFKNMVTMLKAYSHFAMIWKHSKSLNPDSILNFLLKHNILKNHDKNVWSMNL